ncbi:hypothetical protein PNEG_03527 [Pneumocystis murina B123]|uniref:GTP-binding protein yptV4 n=1 Tax=Pneumocystis murina (strain B123) TaxID=1069680 RepID=M7NLL5_PNEMU|nr:hypothetical protein PNEG_03527 [Pneumocystis murina B123]EMR08087.1 hypothetical protein PNEG_03527 [Pneumocystis murina B123]
MDDWVYTIKFVIIGDSGVGKSNLMRRMMNNQYLERHDATIGIEWGARIIDIDGVKMKLQLWDTAGQETFHAMTRNYYRGSSGALLVYDITRRETFEHMAVWLEDLKMYGSSNISIALVGNKADLENTFREVGLEEARKWANEKGICIFAEVSAKTGDQVNESFMRVARDIYGKILSNQLDVNDRLNGIKVRRKNLLDMDVKQGKRCC